MTRIDKIIDTVFEESLLLTLDLLKGLKLPQEGLTLSENIHISCGMMMGAFVIMKKDRLPSEENKRLYLETLEKVKSIQGNWIKCSDRLPDTDRKVLVGNTSGWDIAFLDKDEAGDDFWRTESWVPVLNDYLDRTVTHWQELPALPEEEQ